MPNQFKTVSSNSAPKFFGKGRSRHDLSHVVSQTGNTGDLIVTLCEPVVPGATFSLRTASLTRLETSLHQTLDNAYVEFAYFFVPARQLWSNFDKYQGFNRDAWAQTINFTKPQIKLVADTSGDSSIGDIDTTFQDRVLPQSLMQDLYMPATEVPSYDSTSQLAPAYLEIDQLPLRAVFKCYNEYFRDQNFDSEIYYDDGNSDKNVTQGYFFNGSYFYPYHGRLHVNRYKDIFSTAFPQPQKGDAVKVLLGDTAPLGVVNTNGTLTPLEVSSGATGTVKINGISVTGTPVQAALAGVNFTVNDLRIAIALQSMRERDARSGNRLNEKLYGTWHIQANNLELDRSEYLGGKRVPITMMEVLQTSETGNTVLGSDAGHSKTFDADDSFSKTFTQWGYIIGFVWVRTNRSYSQGIDRKFFVKDILDEYDPMLDNIGEQPIYKRELNAVLGAGNTVLMQNKVWGYQEAWYQYKKRLNRYSGMFQPGIQGTLDSWHYGDNYVDYAGNSLEPFIGPDWLKEGPEQVDRTIAVGSSAGIAAFQWKFNIAFEMYSTFESSVHSMPNTFGF